MPDPRRSAPTGAPARWPRAGITFIALGAVLVGFSWWLRSGPLAPSSLWLDDLWVVAPSQASSLSDAAGMLVTSPLFSILVNVPLVITGPSSVVAQALPFLAGVAAPVLVLAVSRWMGWRWYAGLVAAVAVTVAPQHVVFSTRVKQYTLEAAIGFVVIGLAWRVVGRRSSPWTLAAVAAVATVVSGSAGAFAGAVLGATVLAAGRDAETRRRLVGPVAAFAFFALAWWALYLRTHVSDGLRRYWQDDFLSPGDGVSVFLSDLGGSLDRMAQGFFPLAPAWPWLLAATLAVTVMRPRLAVLLAAPVGAAIVLAAIEAAPLGTGRTDIYLLPAAVMAVGGAFDAAGERIRMQQKRWLLPASAVVLGAVLVAAFLVRDLRPRAYPAEDVRAFVSAAEEQRSDDGRTIVYPATRWAYAVYTDGGFEPVPSDNETGFDVEITTPGVSVLGPHRDHPERYVPELEAATAGVDAVTFVASHWRSDITAIEHWFTSEGWTEIERLTSDGGLLVRWRRLN